MQTERLRLYSSRNATRSPYALPRCHVPRMSQTLGRVRSPSLHSCDEIVMVTVVVVVMLVVMIMVVVVVVGAAREATEEAPYK